MWKPLKTQWYAGLWWALADKGGFLLKRCVLVLVVVLVVVLVAVVVGCNS